jgi:hypothetical protein
MRYKIKLRNEPVFEVEGEVYLFNCSDSLQNKVAERHAISLNADEVVFIKKVEDKGDNVVVKHCHCEVNIKDVYKRIIKAIDEDRMRSMGRY